MFNRQLRVGGLNTGSWRTEKLPAKKRWNVSLKVSCDELKWQNALISYLTQPVRYLKTELGKFFMDLLITSQILERSVVLYGLQKWNTDSKSQSALFYGTDKVNNSSLNSLFFDNYCIVRIYDVFVRHVPWRYCQYFEKLDTAVIVFWIWNQNIFHWQTEGDGRTRFLTKE